MNAFRERLVALAATLILPLALRVVSLRAVLAICDRWPVFERPRHPPHALARRVHRWMARGRGPWAGTCLTHSLVLYAMLRQHGYRPRFIVGVAGVESSFSAHAWVTIDGVPLGNALGGVDRYTMLMSHGA